MGTGALVHGPGHTDRTPRVASQNATWGSWFELSADVTLER